MARGQTSNFYQVTALIIWLEIPLNFKLITGGAAKGPVVAGAKLKKSDAYKMGYTTGNEFEISRNF